MLHVAGMKTKSEFPDYVYLDFIKQHSIPSVLPRDLEMSQRVQQIHRDLVIASKVTEANSALQNPAELNGANYLNSHAQVLIYLTGATDFM
jgi:hypothetical protein